MGSPKKVTTGYRYNMGLQMGFCHTPDALLELGAGDRVLWAGQVGSNTSLALNKPNLFGGDEREGGIVGTVDVMFGEETQVANSYLASVQGDPQPAYRGFLGLVFRGQIAVNNPYIKPWYARVRSIVNGWDGGTCWYEEKAALVSTTYAAADHEWRYLVVDKADGTNRSATDFDDSAWAAGRPPFASHAWTYPGEFGFETEPATVVPVAKKVWMRTTLTLSKVPATMRFQAFVDNDCRLYVNGTLVTTVGGNNGAYYDVPISVDAFQVGENLIAVEGWDRHTATYPSNFFWFDWRLTMALDRQAMNPAHIIYQALTDPDWGMGYPVTTIDDASFTAAADALHAEGFGLCFKWNNSSTIEEFTQVVADHAGLVYGQDRRTGLFRMRLLRQDYDPATLRRFTKADTKVVRYQRPSLADTVNEIVVQFTDNATGKEATTAPLQNLAHIQAVGRVISQTLSFSGLPTHDLAVRVGMRELQARSTPLWRFSLEFKRAAFDLLPGEPFVLDLLDTELGLEVVLRAGDVDYGEPGAEGVIRAECVEDVFGLPEAGYVENPGGGGSLPDTTPQPATGTVYEAPYVEVLQGLGSADTATLPDQAGYLVAMAERPSGSPSNFGLNTRIPPEAYVLVSTGDFTPTGELLVAAVPEPSTMLDVADAADLDALEVGAIGWLGEGVTAEMVRVDAVATDEVGFGGYAVTVGRGCGDTVPKAWPIGTRLWVSSQGAGSDPTQYAATDVVNAKLTPRTSDGELALASAAELSVTMAGRQSRPYPPGQFKLGGAYYPAAIDRTASAAAWAVTWADRDRLLQADEVEDTDAASIGPEPTTRYALRFLRADTSAVLVEELSLGGTSADVLLAYTGDVVAELYAISDLGESWQRHRWTFAHTANAGTAASSIEGTAYTPPAATVIDGGGA